MLAADWARVANRTTAQRLALLVFRVGQYLHARGRRGPLYYAWRIADLFYLRAVLGAELPRTAMIGAGLALPHAGRGVSIGEDTVIGANSMIFPRVTIGREGKRRSPRLGDDVYVGTGACILGEVTIGSGAHIGANTVVLQDVPEGATAFGVPARVLKGMQSAVLAGR